ncbi:MAG: hypothetical protein MUC36_16905 [Planctomycetes bacterium]|jgi:hypothetical protein|nr:hypothetical protein [Planctomycetota bacterium]
MTDFGANIFDDSQATPKPPASAPAPAREDRGTRAPRSRSPRRTAAPPATTEPPAAVPPAAEPTPPPTPKPTAAAAAAAANDEATDAPTELEPAPQPPSEAPDAAPRHGRHARFERRDQHDRPAPRSSEPTGERPDAPPRAPRERGDQLPSARTQQPRRDDAREPRGAAAPRPPLPPRPRDGARIALLVDLDALHTEARAQQREVAMHRLRPALAGGRPVARAIAFTSSSRTPPSGFELQPGASDATFATRFAKAAHQLAQEHGELLLAPATPAALQLVERLQHDGYRASLASLLPGGARDGVRQLGRECLFVP